MAFNEYPKMMSHPQHKAAVWQQNDKVGPFDPGTTMISSEMLPPVTVSNRNQEEYYVARGYRPNNNPDPVAYEQALLESDYTGGYEFKAYPKWKYHPMEIPVIVKNQAEEDNLGDGWHDSPVLATEDDLIGNPSLVPPQSKSPEAQRAKAK